MFGAGIIRRGLWGGGARRYGWRPRKPIRSATPLLIFVCIGDRFVDFSDIPSSSPYHRFFRGGNPAYHNRVVA